MMRNVKYGVFFILALGLSACSMPQYESRFVPIKGFDKPEPYKASEKFCYEYATTTATRLSSAAQPHGGRHGSGQVNITDSAVVYDISRDEVTFNTDDFDQKLESCMESKGYQLVERCVKNCTATSDDEQEISVKSATPPAKETKQD